jgi:predicted N-formylglutamate amidohydrolase
MKKKITSKKTATKKKTAVKPIMPVARKQQLHVLAKDEPPTVRVENAKGAGKCVIVCDHASNRIPKALGTLGLSAAALKKHIAWDPGTEDIGLHLSKALDAPAIISGYSRLVTDLNRGHDSDECMREVSDKVKIPGNVALTPTEKTQRLDEIFWPYHRQVDLTLRRYLERGVAPVLLSIHSFTPKMDGQRRPWQLGILWNREEELAKALIARLRRDNPGINVGENEPYSLKSENFTKNTVSTHAESRGLPYVIVEFRQDLVNTPKKAKEWAGIFLRSLKPLLADPALFKLRKTAKK